MSKKHPVIYLAGAVDTPDGCAIKVDGKVLIFPKPFYVCAPSGVHGTWRIRRKGR